MKEETNIASASLNGVRSSPRKMRLIANLIRNKEIFQALDLLSYSKKRRISFMFKTLLLSLLSNWKKKYNQSYSEKIKSLYIKEIRVNQGRTLKRLRPVPQGRGHRIRKRSSNIIVFLDKKQEI
ncbi:50S ribosomal protein L22 [Blattabacterium sp. (Nauphoeta cinerea)]|uniref:large ribosomal subunit protein uL22 n=1 Tax=Blattabacterium sp. (Nauphoeta cinerea) TaxID=1316444 RepID=UPI0003B0A081|nr:uL22 family ribosomal protein [Blattabacterium sp. (Nauphoeta cinerea)]AGW86012.1 50S ribosomal protein L22 [Blattabacterium sp. (Nauphoeta cinerea)]